MFQLGIKGFYHNDGDYTDESGYTHDVFVFTCDCRMERFTPADRQPVNYYCTDQDAPNNGAFGWEWYESCPSHKEFF